MYVQASGKRKETVLDLNKHMDTRLRVKFAGGREGVSIFQPDHSRCVIPILDVASLCHDSPSLCVLMQRWVC